MKIVFSILFCINCMTLFGQSIEIFGGPNKNVFHDYHKNQGHFISSYNSGFGYSVGVGIDSIKVDRLTLRLTLQFDKYNGKLKASDGGLGGGNTTEAKVDKSVISFGIFPIKFRIIKRIDLNFGLEISRLIVESFSGTNSGWLMGQPNWSYNLQEKYNRYSSLTYLGFRGRISYDFLLSKSITISPQYSYYFGLSNEFDQFPEVTKSMRHYFFIGIKKKIK